jgi:hypothetical protein
MVPNTLRTSDTVRNLTFRHGSKRKSVSNGKIGSLSTVQELTGKGTFSSDKQFLVGLVLVGVSKVHDSQRSSSARVMDDILHNSLDVAMTLILINWSELGGPSSLVGVGSENASRTSTLASDDSTHASTVITQSYCTKHDCALFI